MRSLVQKYISFNYFFLTLLTAINMRKQPQKTNKQKHTHTLKTQSFSLFISWLYFTGSPFTLIKYVRCYAVFNTEGHLPQKHCMIWKKYWLMINVHINWWEAFNWTWKQTEKCELMFTLYIWSFLFSWGLCSYYSTLVNRTRLLEQIMIIDAFESLIKDVLTK